MWRVMRRRTREIGCGEDLRNGRRVQAKFSRVFADSYGVLCPAHPSLATGVDLVPPWCRLCWPLRPLEHGMKENP